MWVSVIGFVAAAVLLWFSIALLCTSIIQDSLRGQITSFATTVGGLLALTVAIMSLQ